mgnify:CR=1 FL=1
MRSESTFWLDSIERIQREREGRTLVFTNGVFDLLHAGHVTYLEQARALGDLLVVALNTDESVRRLGKGPERPLNALADRARVMGALRCVDFVVSFGEDDPTAILSQIRPDIHVKGGDYDPETSSGHAERGSRRLKQPLRTRSNMHSCSPFCWPRP